MTQSKHEKNFKMIKHGEWNFEYSPKQNIFTTSIESFEKGLFQRELGEDCLINLTENDLDDFRRASVIHKIARKKALSMLYSNGKLADLVDAVEEIILKLCNQDPKTYYLHGSHKNNSSGLAFPVGVNINNIVAHDSKIVNQNGKSDQRIFFNGDVVKIDIGVHINGRIIDSAFTHIVTDKPGVHDSDNIYNPVLDASRDSMFNAVKMAGPDQRLDEISECIDEIIRSYEVTMGSNEITIPIRPVKGIGGHNIKQYQIHGGKLILSHS
nr:methionine aminopeptidase 2-like [Hydra vulgaris]